MQMQDGAVGRKIDIGFSKILVPAIETKIGYSSTRSKVSKNDLKEKLLRFLCTLLLFDTQSFDAAVPGISALELAAWYSYLPNEIPTQQPIYLAHVTYNYPQFTQLRSLKKHCI